MRDFQRTANRATEYSDMFNRFISWLWLGWAFLLATLVMLPVLLWPHFGLFSDAGQILSFPQEVIANFPQSLALLRPLEDGRWNPLFHGLTISIYYFAGSSARAFFTVQWMMLAFSSMSIAWIIATITRSKKLGLLGSILFCTASSIFENFYTLDKVEPRITFFTALAVTLLVARYYTLKQKRQATETKEGAVWFFTIQFLLGMLIVFSKETGGYLAAASSVCILMFHWNKPFRNNLCNPARGVVWPFAVAHVTAAILFITLFKVLSVHMTYRYVSYPITAKLVLQNTLYYMISSPELALALAFAVYWGLKTLIPKLPGAQDSLKPAENFLLVFFSLALLAYFAGIVLWRWALDYYLLPAHYMAALVLPLTIHRMSAYR